MTYEELAKGNKINKLIHELEDDISLLKAARNRDCLLRVNSTGTFNMLKLGKQERDTIINVLLGGKSIRLEELKKELEIL